METQHSHKLEKITEVKGREFQKEGKGVRSTAVQKSRRMGLKESHQSAPVGSEVKMAAGLSACSY